MISFLNDANHSSNGGNGGNDGNDNTIDNMKINCNNDEKDSSIDSSRDRSRDRSNANSKDCSKDNSKEFTIEDTLSNIIHPARNTFINNSIVRIHKCDESVWAVTTTANSELMAFGGDDNTLTIVDLRSNNRKQNEPFSFDIIHKIPFEKRVETLSFSNDDALLAVGGFDNKVHIYEVSNILNHCNVNEPPLPRQDPIQFKSGVRSLDFSPNNELLAIGDTENIHIYNVITKKFILHQHQDGEDYLNGASFSPIGGNLLAFSVRNTIKMMDVTNQIVIWQSKYNEAVLTLAHSHDAAFLAVGGRDRKLSIFNALGDCSLIRTIPFDVPINCVEYSFCGNYIAVGCEEDGHVYLYCSVQFELLHTFFAGRDNQVNSLAFHYTHSDGSIYNLNGGKRSDASNDNLPNTTRQMLTVGCKSGAVITYDIEAHRSPIIFPSSRNGGLRIKPLPLFDGQIFLAVVGGQDKVLRVIDVYTTRVLQTINQPSTIYCIDLSVDGKHLAVGGRDGFVNIYERCCKQSSTKQLTSDTMNKNDHITDSSIDRYEWDIELQLDEETSNFLSRKANIQAMTYSPCGTFLAIGSKDKMINIYHIGNDGKYSLCHEVPIHDVMCSLSFHQSMTQMVVGTQEGYAKFYHIIDHQPESLSRFKNGYEHIEKKLETNLVQSITFGGDHLNATFAPDGSFVVCGGGKYSTIVKIGILGNGAKAHDGDDTASILKLEKDDFLEIDYKTFCADVDVGDVKRIIVSPNSDLIVIGTKTGIVCTFQIKMGNEQATNSITPAGFGKKKIQIEHYGRTIYCPANITWLEFRTNPMAMNKSPTSDESYNTLLNYQEYQSLLIGSAENTYEVKLHSQSSTPRQFFLQVRNEDRIVKILEEDQKSFRALDEHGNAFISEVPFINQSDQIIATQIRQNNAEVLLMPKQQVHKASSSFNHHTYSYNNGLLKQCSEKYWLNLLDEIMGAQCISSTTASKQIDEMKMVLDDLAKRDLSVCVISVLNAKSDIDHVPAGFVIGGGIYVKEPKSKLATITQFFSRQGGDMTKEEDRLLSRRLPSRPSTAIQEILNTWTKDLEWDENKSIKMIILRAILPDLGSLESLKILTDMSDVKVFECLSLQEIINAHWNGWAKYLSYLQLVLYCLILISFTSFCEVTKLQVESCFIYGDADACEQWLQTVYLLWFIVLIGLSYFICVEIRQMIILSKRHYWKDRWSLWQWISKALMTSTLCIRRFYGPNHSEKVEEWIGYICALTLFFSWMSLFHYLRGIEECAWIYYALCQIAQTLYGFVLVISLVIAIFALCFRFLYDGSGDSDAFGSIGKSMTTTFFAGTVGDFNLDDLASLSLSAPLSLALFILLLLIVLIVGLNALIAFISEKFEIVLDMRNAVLMKVKAKVILDMYCMLTTRSRKQVEKEYKWVTMLVPESDLTLDVDKSNPYSLANLSRATKDDMEKQKRYQEKILNAKIDEIKQEHLIKIDEQNTKMQEMKKEHSAKMKEIQKELSLQTEKIDKMTSILEKIAQNSC